MPKGLAYSPEELHSFLDTLEEILPISATAWERVTEVHLSRYPDMARTVDSLKRKFKELHIKKILTGDPNCPPAVRRAKVLRQQIIESMNATDLNEGSEGDNEEDGEDEEDEDDQEEEEAEEDEDEDEYEDEEAEQNAAANLTAVPVS